MDEITGRIFKAVGKVPIHKVEFTKHCAEKGTGKVCNQSRLMQKKSPKKRG